MPVPKFAMYYPSEEAMDDVQLAFYKSVEASLQNGEYIDVDGQISYVFVYLYKLLYKWDKSGYERLSEYLIYASELYKHEKKLSDYCLSWAYDCLLGLRKYDVYLARARPASATLEVLKTATR